MMKLWQKDTSPDSAVEKFTVGRDREMDLRLAGYDIVGSLAHTQMLQSIGLLTIEEFKSLAAELKKNYELVRTGRFQLEDGVEDIHSQVELLLTKSLGEAGKKIHSARSRNDQVLVDIRLFLRDELGVIVEKVLALFELLQSLSEKHKDDLIPGYTHLQVAMPSSFGLWFGAYAESLVDDVIQLGAAFEITNKNPLGSAAGYGSSFPINRTLTTELLGFETLNYNVVYAQMGRGKTERVIAQAMSGIAETLSRLSMDACLFMSQNFGFISFPENLTTGSSIMPHKKNPDVFELVRSHCNRIKALPNEISMMTTNLPSGYHRDLQLLKEHLFPALENIKDCIDMIGLMLSHVSVNRDIISDPRYRYIFSVEEVNKLVLSGVPFRDAYRKIGSDIESGNFHPEINVQHSHEGSIGNLCTLQIRGLMDKAVAGIPIEKTRKAIERLLSRS